ncbi:hypothetical protein AMAG_20544 [Allomyces macrogynus ATCC 38327]|uniref:Uncharacterized protein n=1 Tax=Allomyces macrogynus (strain ATCC 38327) TaxID=578462 RepID=A0A0L0TBK6_ALLM3|nr:hypothetical protein AMAG_20544 [Allomyces macrogynus ATCC 38327]|eukprot:KNE72132.1 hypothetical protein AMAG_20544 [Allomyces macrogynus ATCC 38327]
MAANDDEEFSIHFQVRALRPSATGGDPRFEIVAPTYTTPNTTPKPLLGLHAHPTITLTRTARAVIRAALALPLVMEEAVIAGGGVASMALVPPAMPATAMPGTAPWTKDTSALLADLARVQAAMSQMQPQANGAVGTAETAQQQPSLMYQPLTPATAAGTSAFPPTAVPAAFQVPGLPMPYAGMLASSALAGQPSTSAQQQSVPQIVPPQVVLPTAAAAAAAAAAQVAQFQHHQQQQGDSRGHGPAAKAPAVSLAGAPDHHPGPRPPLHRRPKSRNTVSSRCRSAPHLRNHLSDYLRALGVTIARYRWDKRPDDANAMMPYAIVEMVGSVDLERRLVIGLQTHSFDGTVVAPFRLPKEARVDLTKDFTDVLDRAAIAATELLMDPARAPPVVVAPAIVAARAAPVTVSATVPAVAVAPSIASAITTVDHAPPAPRARGVDPAPPRTSTTTSRHPIHDDEPGALPPRRSRSRSRSRSSRHARSRSPTYRARRRSVTPDDDHYRHSRRVARFKVTNLPNDKRTSPIFLTFFAQAGHALYMHWTMGTGGAPASAIVEMTRHSLIVKRMMDLDGCVLFDRPISIDVVDPDDKKGVTLPRKPPAVFLVTGIPATGNRYNQMRHYMHSFGQLYQLDWRFRSRDKICYAFVSMQDDGSQLALKADGCEFYGGTLKVERITDPATFFADPTLLEAKLEAAYPLASRQHHPYHHYQYQNSYVPSAASARAPPPPPLLPSGAAALTLAFPSAPAAPTSADARLGGMMFGSAATAKIITSPTVATAHGDAGAGMARRAGS